MKSALKKMRMVNNKKYEHSVNIGYIYGLVVKAELYFLLLLFA